MLGLIGLTATVGDASECCLCRRNRETPVNNSNEEQWAN